MRPVMSSINMRNLRNPRLFIDLCSQPTRQVASKNMTKRKPYDFGSREGPAVAYQVLPLKGGKYRLLSSYFKCNNFINLDRRHSKFDDAASLLELDPRLCSQKRCSLDLYLARKLDANRLVAESNWLAHSSSEGVRAVVVEQVHGKARFRLPRDHFHESFTLHVNGIVITYEPPHCVEELTSKINVIRPPVGGVHVSSEVGEARLPYFAQYDGRHVRRLLASVDRFGRVNGIRPDVGHHGVSNRSKRNAPHGAGDPGCIFEAIGKGVTLVNELEVH